MGNEHLENIKNQLDMYPILLDRMPQGVATLNEDGVILYCNPSFAEMISLPSEQVVGTKFQNYIANDSKEHFEELYEQSWKGPIKNEIHLHDHASIIMPVILSANTFELGNETMLSVILTDVSVHNKNQNEMKIQAEELEKKLHQLQESEERFGLIVENVKDYSIIMLDPDGNIKTWNKGAERIKGYSAKEIIGKHISIMYTHEELDRKEPETNLRMAKKLGRYESEAWRVRKDGSIFFADVIITSLYDAQNNFHGYAKITRDITERKLAEDKLKESEERFRLTVENVKDYSIIMLDPDGNIKTWNKGAERIKGYSAKEIIGKHISIMYTQEELDRNEPETNLRMAKKLGRYESEAWRVRKDGTTFFADVIITSLYDAHNNFHGYAKITRDITERKLAEDSLKESEERFRLIVENVKDYSIIMLDPDGNIKTWNKGAERIKGYTAKEIIGKHISIVYTQEELDRHEPETNLQMAKSLGRYESEAWRVRKDGGFFFADVIITSLYDSENNFRGYAKITRDITERREADEKLKDSETQIRTIFKSAPDAVTVIDEAGNITKWNPRAEEIFGWSAEEVLGQPLHEIIVPERYREGHINGMKHFLATREGAILNKPVEMPALRKNDSEIQIELSISHFQFKKKDFFIGFLKDITERKIAEDKLKESEERFLKIFANSPVATTLSEIKTNKIAFANKLFYDTFGYNEEEVIGHTSEDLNLIAPDEYNRVIAFIMDSLDEKRTLAELEALSVEDTEALVLKLKQGNALKDLEIQYTRKNGETFYAILFYETIRIGNQSYTITSYQDITDRKIAEEKVKQKSRELELLNQELALKNKESEKRATQLSMANIELIFQIEEKEKKDAALTTANTDIKEKKELIAHKDSILAILSHDLRSPLTGIIGAARHLQSHVEEMSPAQRKEILTLLYEASIKELNMLDYLVEWARIKYASDVFSPAHIKLSHYVKIVFETLKDTAVMRTISLYQEIDENSTVFADGKMLLSILQNIVSNAIKHTQPDGKITITAVQNNLEIVVEIKDTGIGMSQEVQKNLFTPQMDSLSKERKDDKGAGIGLLLVKGFLEKNGGRIWVESEEGVGSSFYFTLPIYDPLDKMS